MPDEKPPTIDLVAAESPPPVKVRFADLGKMHAELVEEFDAVWRQVVADSSFIGGPLVETFEREWAAYCGREHAIGVANGTDAIVLVLRALGIGQGDEVIVPTNTFVATAEAVVLAGATPRFVDVDDTTLLMTPQLTEAAIGPRTAAVLVVDLYGHVPDMAALQEVADRHGIKFLVDAAQAHGSKWRGTPAGAFGLAATFSFYPGKNLGALGDAGAIVTDDAELADTIRSIANHGRTGTSHYVHGLVGTNSRLDALQAGLLSVKLRALDRWTERRREIVEQYRQQLEGTPIRIVMPPADCESGWHLLVVRVRGRDTVQKVLRLRGVETGVHYPLPCHRQQAYRDDTTPRLLVSERSAGELLSLPLHPHLTRDDVATVCRELRAVVKAEASTNVR